MDYKNIYNQNEFTGATANPLMPTPDAIDEAFAVAANQIINNAVELARQLIGTHQAAIAIVINKDWHYVRKFFSLSEKYAAWANYAEPATGYGIHAYLLHHNKAMRFTQQELEAHPQWKNFGAEEGKHPPMNGWLAVPIIDSSNTNWGLMQLSDKYEGEFTAADEQTFTQFAAIVSQALDALWQVRNLKKQLVLQS